MSVLPGMLNPMSTMTKAVQRAAVGEGLALGLIANDVWAFTTDKMGIESSFRRAWRDWDHRGDFPQVKVTIERNDLLSIINRLENQHSGTGMVGWANLWPFELWMTDDWPLEEVGERLAIWSGVPLAGWQDLASRFLDDLKPEILS